MVGSVRVLALAALIALAVPLAAQQTVQMRGNTPVAPPGYKSPALPDAPVRYETAEGQNIRVSVHARGFKSGWSMVSVAPDTLLVTERAGRIRVIRNGVLEPAPVAGAPMSRGNTSMLDMALHPDFTRNGNIYISYSKPLDEKRTSLAIARAKWDGKALTGTTDIFVSDGGGGGPIAFGGDGMLYVASSGPENAIQNPNTLAGKILRLTDAGAVPPDNPFVGRRDARPEIFTIGHRNTLRMARHPGTGAIWQLEMGPNGGDEVNILEAGANYGWPLVSLGRTYAGPWQAPFTKEGFRDPVIYWMPSIASASLAFYTGDKLPKWKGDVFVAGMRYGEIPGTGQVQRVLINQKLEELRREPLLVDMRRRIRDVKEGKDGLLYVLTDDDDGAILRIEPAE
jgi:glucose/arabinose dehydrogenase